MNTIEATVTLFSGSTYTQIFSNGFELDAYYESNKHIVKKIVSI